MNEFHSIMHLKLLGKFGYQEKLEPQAVLTGWEG